MEYEYVDVPEVEVVDEVCKYCQTPFSYIPVVKKAPVQGRKSRKAKKSKRVACDLCAGSSARMERCKKYGPEYADLTREDRRHLDVKKHLKEYVFGLTMIPPSELHSQWEQAWPMADNECVHGRLKNDPCPSPRVEFMSKEFKGRVVQTWPHDHPCMCWGEENGKVPERPIGSAC